MSRLFNIKGDFANLFFYQHNSVKDRVLSLSNPTRFFDRLLASLLEQSPHLVMIELRNIKNRSISD